MLANAVRELQTRQSEIASQIRSLTEEAKKIDQALDALNGLTGGRGVSPARLRALAKARAARRGKGKTKKAALAKSTSRRRKMSPLGRLRIKLGALNRYGKKEAAQKLAARIAALEAKAAQS